MREKAIKRDLSQESAKKRELANRQATNNNGKEQLDAQYVTRTFGCRRSVLR